MATGLALRDSMRVNETQRQLFDETSVCVEPDPNGCGFVFLNAPGVVLDWEQATRVAREILVCASPPKPMTHEDLMRIVEGDSEEE